MRPHSSLNDRTPEEFESAIMNEEFRKKWTEKELGGINMLNSLNELKNCLKIVEPHQSFLTIFPSASRVVHTIIFECISLPIYVGSSSL